MLNKTLCNVETFVLVHLISNVAEVELNCPTDMGVIQKYLCG